MENITSAQVKEAIDQLAAMTAAASITPEAVASVMEKLRNLTDAERQQIVEVASAYLTEINTKSQEWLNRLLSTGGSADKIVTKNGSNVQTELDTLGSEVGEIESIVSVLPIEEKRTSQLFNKDGAVLYSIAVNSAKNIVNDSWTRAIYVEINGKVGDAYYVNFLPSLPDEIIDSLSSVAIFASDSILSAGQQSLQIGVVNNVAKRASIRLAQDSRYLCFMMKSTSSAAIESIIYRLLGSLMIVKALDFATEYEPYTTKMVVIDKEHLDMSGLKDVFMEKDAMDISKTEDVSIENPIQSTTNGYISANQNIGQQIALIPDTARGYQVFAIPSNSVVKVLFSELTGAYGFAITDTNNNVLESCTNQNKTDYTFALQSMPTKLWVSKNKYASSQRTTILKTDGNVALKELWESRTPNLWQGKKLWWCGTSIPAGSDSTLESDSTIAGHYPKEVGLLLSASVENVAEGGSMCRANVRTGDYQGANYANISSALSMTIEEVETFIANYDTIKSKLEGAPSAMSESYKKRMREASFEVKLLPYLDGRKPMPDLFVIDHGHNDYKYKMPDNSSDITLEPTLANISGGILAEDLFMTENNNAKLESFFGSLANIPSAKKASFIASVNRNCYIGAVNFIVTLILRYNPHARIMFVSNYEYKNGDNAGYAPLITAQKNVSESWAFPLCEVWKSLGYSSHIIPNSKDWFNTKYPSVTPSATDVSVFRAYCPDSVHPHSDTSGDANIIYSVVLSEFIKTIR